MASGAVIKQEVVGTPKSVRLDMMPFKFCPGCHESLVWRALGEVIDELGIEGKAIACLDIGCSGVLLVGLSVDGLHCLHGRSTAVAAGVKRVLPEAICFNIGGDGSLGAIGSGHMVNVMMRSDPITTIFLNNSGYGMTGGQVAPTTLAGLRTTTTPEGRNVHSTGYPLHLSEIAAAMPGTAYVSRVSVHRPANYQRAKKAIKTAFQKQIDGVGYSLVEILCACPTDWALSPLAANKFVADKLIAEFPLGEFKNVDKIEYPLDPEISSVGRVGRG
jgi:2-oxoglutarate ferredoxin oxidoreductase subunit beta